MSMKRPDPSSEPTGFSKPMADSAFRARCPMLYEYLSSATWEDASPRELSTLLFQLEDGLWKACLNDRACERSLWRTGQSMGDAIDALESALVAQTADWRRWRAGSTKRKWSK